MKSHTIPVNNISLEEEKAIWELYQQSYSTPKAVFQQKQKSLDYYAIFYVNHQIVGFSGLRDQTFEVENKSFRAIYLGQTILKKQFRGKAIIQRYIIRLIFKHYLSFNRSQLIFWSNAITYRPFLILAKGLKHYYPNPNYTDKPLNKMLKKVCTKLGKVYYQDAFNPQTGVVTKENQYVTKNELVLTEKDNFDPHINYFIQSNPDYKKGNGLLIITPVLLSNLAYYFFRKTIFYRKKAPVSYIQLPL